MLGIGFAIFFGCFMIADAIMFVNGYRGYIFRARTEQEKKVRKHFFSKKLAIIWDGKG